MTVEKISPEAGSEPGTARSVGQRLTRYLPLGNRESVGNNMCDSKIMKVLMKTLTHIAKTTYKRETQARKLQGPVVQN